MAAQRAFGGKRRALVVREWPNTYRRLMQEMGSGPVYGSPTAWTEAQGPSPCGGVHKFEDRDFHRICVFCGLDSGLARGACVEGAERHHRSCALRLGGSSCTC